MKTYIISSALIMVALMSSAFLFQQPPEESIRKHYKEKQQDFLKSMISFRNDVRKDLSVKKLQHDFLHARIAYKHVEPYLEYYFELDVSKLNGPPIDFIEEEDPAAYHTAQGFQVIAEKLFSGDASQHRAAVEKELDDMIRLTEGLLSNAETFIPEAYAMDAAMESLYRLTALGLAGFDSPRAQLSLQEAKATLASIQYIVSVYAAMLPKEERRLAEQANMLFTGAGRYFDRHKDFISFDRAECITSYLNPLADAMGTMIERMELPANKNRYSLIRKKGRLFDKNGLMPEIFMGDEVFTAAKAELGKKLFYEPLLSANGQRSCAGCHDPKKAFTDGLPRALQTDGHSPLARSTPTLCNAALQRKLFADSRQPSLYHLILEVLGNSKEMNMSADSAMLKIFENQQYRLSYSRAYPESTSMKTRDLVNSMAMFLFTVTSYNARFDQYMRGEKNAMNDAEIRGFNLYMGKAKCATCHFIPFTNGSKPPLFYYQESEVIGVPEKADTINAIIDPDPGRYTDLKKEFLRHSFKTPTLRNISLTGPYMHNGVFKTLEEVIDFYDRGGGTGIGIIIPNQSLPPEKLGLTATEKKQLQAFLGTLTSEN